jgi:BirA family biotin operon repressor/biotin-[acetyl-CoA-carboxylase] ligase
MVFDSVDSTQDIAAHCLSVGDPVGVIFAHEQLAGRGRFGRKWYSQRGDSLTASLVFHDYADHPKPHLIGMAVAIAAAGALYAQLRWPNDLIVGVRKVGGILTELLQDGSGRRIPVVGLGINLNQSSFPEEVSEIATSLSIEHGGRYEGDQVLRSVLERLEHLPEPTDWSELAPMWSLFDKTPGKMYRLADGTLATAVGVGSDGQLLCSVAGESRAVLAAEALFGPAAV